MAQPDCKVLDLFRVPSAIGFFFAQKNSSIFALLTPAGAALALLRQPWPWQWAIASAPGAGRAPTDLWALVVSPCLGFRVL